MPLDYNTLRIRRRGGFKSCCGLGGGLGSAWHRWLGNHAVQGSCSFDDGGAGGGRWRKEEVKHCLLLEKVVSLAFACTFFITIVS